MMPAPHWNNEITIWDVAPLSVKLAPSIATTFPNSVVSPTNRRWVCPVAGHSTTAILFPFCMETPRSLGRWWRWGRIDRQISRKEAPLLIKRRARQKFGNGGVWS